jgi:alpha-D-ribose 1-methylphosphonate 5-triphosphate synthase subunit PhnH
MSALTAIGPYDPVFDGQKHYRALLNCTARPGTIGLLDDVQLEFPAGLSHAMALVALTLFSSDVSFHLQSGHLQSGDGDKAVADFLRRQTQAFEASPSRADFLLLDGEDDGAAVEALKLAKRGSLDFPETGATAILQVASVSPAPLGDGLKLVLAGPGIETEAVVFVAGLSQAFLEVHSVCNREFPAGIDLILACDSLSAGPCILSLPRTTKVRWESL